MVFSNQSSHLSQASNIKKKIFSDFREREEVEGEREREIEREREREGDSDLLFHLFLHSVFASCMCPGQDQTSDLGRSSSFSPQ